MPAVVCFDDVGVLEDACSPSWPDRLFPSCPPRLKPRQAKSVRVPLLFSCPIATVRRATVRRDLAAATAESLAGLAALTSFN